MIPNGMTSRRAMLAGRDAAVRKGDISKEDPAGEVRRVKQQNGPGMVILGSGTIVAQLAQEGLVDEYQMIVNPIAIGKGGRCSKG
jgi:dihydrofolate reductase